VVPARARRRSQKRSQDWAPAGVERDPSQSSNFGQGVRRSAKVGRLIASVRQIDAFSSHRECADTRRVEVVLWARAAERRALRVSRQEAVMFVRAT